MLRFVWVFLVFVSASPASADSRLHQLYPNNDITITKSPIAQITTIYSPNPPPQLTELMGLRFKAMKLPAPQVLPMTPGTLFADVNRPGTALVLKAEDTAHQMIDPLFDDSAIRFYITTEEVTTEEVSIRIANGNTMGRGRQIWLGDGPQALILANGALQPNYRIIYVPDGIDQERLVNLFRLAGIQTSEFRRFVTEELQNLRRPDVAVLTEITAFASEGIEQFPLYYSDFRIHALNNKIEMRDVTPPLRLPKTATVTTPTPEPVPQQPAVAAPALPTGIAAIDRSEAKSLPIPKAPDVVEVTKRSREEFDFSAMAANTCHVVTPQGAKDRVALVIGNGSYFPDIGWLENPPNDATKIAAQLSGNNVKVYYATEASKTVIEDCAERMAVENRDIDLAILYYSGHGLQQNNKNYIVGIEASLKGDLTENLVSFDRIAANLRRISRSTLMFLDACRNNPFESSTSGLADLTGEAGGVTIPADQNDYAVIYAAAPNAVASDGTGDTSPFTSAMLEAMAAPGIPVQEVIVRVSADVQRATNYQQQPYVSSNLTRLIYLGAEVSVEDLQTKAEQAAARAAVIAQRDYPHNVLAEILRTLPTNATDQELATIFSTADRALRQILFRNIVAIPNLDTDYNVAMGFAGHENVVLAKTDGQLHLVDGEDGRLLHQYQLASEQNIFNPLPAGDAAGTKVAYAIGQESVVLLDAATGAVLHTLPVPSGNNTYSNRIYSMRFSPDGKRLLMEIGGTAYHLFDAISGRLLTSFSTIVLPNGNAHNILKTQLHNDGLCFAISNQNIAGATDFFGVGYLGFETNTVEAVYADVGEKRWVERLSCTSDGKYALYQAGNPNGSTNVNEIVDLTTGKVLVRKEETATSTRAYQSFLREDGSTALFNGQNGTILYDLNEREFTAALPPDDIQFDIGEYLFLISPPNGLQAEGFFAGLSDIAFEFAAPPTRIIELAFERLPPDLAEQVQSERPVIPN